MAQVANLSSTGNYSSARYSEFIQKRLQEYGRIDYMLDQFLDPVSIPKGHSTTYKIIKKQRIPTPLSTLTESETPSATTLLIDTVTGTSAQYGIVTEFSDVLELVAFHDVLAQAVDEVGDAMARLRQWIAADAYIALTNVYYPGSVTARSGLAAANTLDRATLSKAVTALRSGLDAKLGAPKPREGANFVLLAPPEALEDLRSDATVLSAMSQGMRPEWLEAGFVGKLEGALIKECNHLPVFTNIGTGMAADTITSGGTEADDSTGTVSGDLSGFRATINASGSLADAVHYCVVVARHKWKGFPAGISSILTLADTNDATSSYDFVMPSDTDYVYDLYFGDSASVSDLFLASATTGLAAGASVNVSAERTSGTTAPVAPAKGVTVYMCPLMGADWGKMVTLDNAQTFMSERKSSDSDPLVQRRKVGAKVHQGAFVNQDDFAIRIEVAS